MGKRNELSLQEKIEMLDKVKKHPQSKEKYAELFKKGAFFGLIKEDITRAKLTYSASSATLHLHIHLLRGE